MLYVFNYSFYSLLFTLILQLIAAESFGQTTRSNTANTNGWFMYFGNHKFSNRLGLHAEAQWRRNEIITQNQQLLLRTGIDYYLKDNSRLTLGYAFVETYPYGEFAVANAFPEHRVWQQFFTAQTIGKTRLTHRYRLEQRMIGNTATGQMKNGRYENRVRYLAKATRTLTPEWKHPLFGAVYNEIFINFGKEVAYNLFDQNRLYAALGLTISHSIKIETGYLYQVIQLRNLDLTTGPKNRIENNHTLQVGIYSTMAFMNKE
jgi:hypothetical protein